jgi:hypothetical protein
MLVDKIYFIAMIFMMFAVVMLVLNYESAFAETSNIIQIKISDGISVSEVVLNE